MVKLLTANTFSMPTLVLNHAGIRGDAAKVVLEKPVQAEATVLALGIVAVVLPRQIMALEYSSSMFTPLP
jgi:hypothetical protein